MGIDWNWGIFLEQAPFGNTTYLGWLWCRAFSRPVQKPHAVVAKLYARIIVSLAGALYAVIAGDLNSVFANAARTSRMW